MTKKRAIRWFWLTLAVAVLAVTGSDLIPHFGGFTTTPFPLYTPEPIWATTAQVVLFLTGLVSSAAMICFGVLWRAFVLDERKAASNR